MATPQETSRDAMSKVNGVMAALNLYPEISTTNSQLSFTMSGNPIDLLVDFFKTTRGYDWLIDKISDFISYAITPLEISIKGVLLSNIRIMLSCSVSPIITEKMIKNGIVFDINQIDLLNMFYFSPLDKDNSNLGRYYYFGCDPEDGVTMIDDLRNVRDFNAVLWYCKNTPGERVVWRRSKDVDKPYIVKENSGNWSKQTKSNGIATIEFNGRSSGLSDAEGNGGVYLQEPINNCVHVYIGCCAPVSANNHKSDISKCTSMINRYNKLKTELDEFENKVSDGKAKNKQTIIDSGANEEALAEVEKQANIDYVIINGIRDAIYGIKNEGQETSLPMNQILDTSTFEFGTIHETLTIDSDLMTSNIVLTQESKINYMNEDSDVEKKYPSATSNYYYLHPLIEWNTDYIMSMKLFDEKVITAQLLDSLTNCLRFNVNVNITPQMQFMQEQVRDLVTRMIETDDGVINDCFFSFTNDSYNNLLNEIELNRVNLHSINTQTINTIPSAEDVMASLNTLSHDATKEELKSVVNNSLLGVIKSTEVTSEGSVGFSLEAKAKFSIIDNLLTQLTCVIVTAILQPKVYILLMSNLKFIGGDPNFDLAKFIQQFSDLISQLVKETRDYILQYFENEVVKVLEELVKTLSYRLSIEQYQYYIELLNRCIDCFRIHGSDWVQDNVDYADITELIQQENQEC